MPNNLESMSIDMKSLMSGQIKHALESQDGILGLPVKDDSDVDSTSILVKGLSINGEHHIQMDSNIVLSVPNRACKHTTIVSVINDGSEVELAKFELDKDCVAVVRSTSPIKVSDFVSKFTNPERELSILSLGDVLDDIKEEAINILNDCGLDINCAFDRVWSLVVGRICGSDCNRDCTYNCDVLDLACHLRKADCERLKAQCKVCERGLEAAKVLVKGWLMTLLPVPLELKALPTQPNQVKPKKCTCNSENSDR
ncbi:MULTISPECIES: hypothetical protein [unclassified Vibrio]|uniref:hypothetical protein n=1 Tax=unclassified Vibrio TaxID=2614977 RepID=UPI0029654DE0|nr:MULTISPECIES: hypothetical protein [unclassified Vibrio]EJA7361038.1 hypothetical protein [Vibrio alginolyticus]MDW2100513.1 hypothetical protein [Vibrio sp. 1580]MDW2275594.1 hypothetical protein [Vibrio sp. 1074]MDW2287418.1 hypothetical protein [Vibrio sp. 1562]